MKGPFARGRRGGLPAPWVVVALVAAEILIAVLVHFVFDVGVPELVLIFASLTVGATVATLEPTLQSLSRPQPALTMKVDGADEGNTRLRAEALRPWPLDVDRIVANEIALAERSLSRHPALENYLRLSDPFAVQPSKRAHAKARSKFEEELQEYEEDLREWLRTYCEAAREHSELFPVTLRLTNRSGAAHAEDVTVVLELPETVTAVKARPTVSIPPKVPMYVAPQPQRSDDLLWQPGLTSPFVTRQPTKLVLPTDPAWRELDDGRRLEASIGDLHAGREAVVGETLLLRARSAGNHTINWHTYTKSARRPSSGTFTLTVPPDDPRPAFGRLGALTKYPDVPMVDDDDVVVHPVRRGDPPLALAAGAKGGDVFARVRERHHQLEWADLGLDPADDDLGVSGEGATEPVEPRSDDDPS